MEDYESLKYYLVFLLFLVHVVDNRNVVDHHIDIVHPIPDVVVDIDYYDKNYQFVHYYDFLIDDHDHDDVFYVIDDDDDIVVVDHLVNHHFVVDIFYYYCCCFQQHILAVVVHHHFHHNSYWNDKNHHHNYRYYHHHFYNDNVPKTEIIENMDRIIWIIIKENFGISISYFFLFLCVNNNNNHTRRLFEYDR